MNFKVLITTAVMTIALSAPVMANNTAISGSNSGASANQGNKQDINISETVIGSKIPNNTPDAIAPGLTTTLNDTCAGSVTGALSLSGFGVGGGSTTEYVQCIIRLHSREMRQNGQVLAAKELMCGGLGVRAAVKRAYLLKVFTNEKILAHNAAQGSDVTDQRDVLPITLMDLPCAEDIEDLEKKLNKEDRSEESLHGSYDAPTASGGPDN